VDDGDDRHRERVARRFAEHPLDLLATITVRVAGVSWWGGRRSNGSSRSLTSQWPGPPKQPPCPKIENEPA